MYAVAVGMNSFDAQHLCCNVCTRAAVLIGWTTIQRCTYVIFDADGLWHSLLEINRMATYLEMLENSSHLRKCQGVRSPRRSRLEI